MSEWECVCLWLESDEMESRSTANTNMPEAEGEKKKRKEEEEGGCGAWNSGGVFRVRFTALTDVIKALMLTSIDRGEHVFTLESIIKFALQRVHPYLALTPLPFVPHLHEAPISLTWRRVVWMFWRCFTHFENSMECVFIIIIIESDC